MPDVTRSSQEVANDIKEMKKGLAELSEATRIPDYRTLSEIGEHSKQQDGVAMDIAIMRRVFREVEGTETPTFSLLNATELTDVSLLTIDEHNPRIFYKEVPPKKKSLLERVRDRITGEDEEVPQVLVMVVLPGSDPNKTAVVSALVYKNDAHTINLDFEKNEVITDLSTLTDVTTAMGNPDHYKGKYFRGEVDRDTYLSLYRKVNRETMDQHWRKVEKGLENTVASVSYEAQRKAALEAIEKGATKETFQMVEALTKLQQERREAVAVEKQVKIEEVRKAYLNLYTPEELKSMRESALVAKLKNYGLTATEAQKLAVDLQSSKEATVADALSVSEKVTIDIITVEYAAFEKKYAVQLSTDPEQLPWEQLISLLRVTSADSPKVKEAKQALINKLLNKEGVQANIKTVRREVATSVENAYRVAAGRDLNAINTAIKLLDQQITEYMKTHVYFTDIPEQLKGVRQILEEREAALRRR